MTLSCGCIDTCKGHPLASSVVPVPPGSLHAPSLLEAAARFCTGLVEQKLGKEPGAIYDKGLGHFVKAAIAEHPDIPQQPLTAGDLLRRAGIIPEKSNPARKKQRSVER